MPILKVKKNGLWEEIAGTSGHTHTTSDIVNFPAMDKYALKSEIPSVEGLATETYVDEAVAGIEIPEASAAIIDVTALPEVGEPDKIYRVPNISVYSEGEPWDDWTCHVVQTRPEIGDVVCNTDTHDYAMYYEASTNSHICYITEDYSDYMSVATGEAVQLTPGWMSFEEYTRLAYTEPFTLVHSPYEANDDDLLYLVVEYSMYVYNNCWVMLNKVGLPGSGACAEIFNHHLNVADGMYSHAEGCDTQALAECAHAEGTYTKAEGLWSHVEGCQSRTSSDATAAHAEGHNAEALGSSSHAEGTHTIVRSHSGHVQGSYNVDDTERKYAHMVGNGNNLNARSNAHTLDWDGNAWFAGDVYVGSTSGTNKDEGSKILATQEYVQAQIQAAVQAALANVLTREQMEAYVEEAILGGEW